VIGEKWYLMLRGSDLDDYSPSHQESSEKKSVSYSHVLPPEMRTVAGAKDILFRLASKALRRLRSYQQRAKYISIRISIRKRGLPHEKYYWECQHSLDLYSNDDLDWMPKISEWLEEFSLENSPHKKDFFPLKVALVFSDLTSLHAEQLELFSPLTEKKTSHSSHLSEVIDALNKKHGYVIDNGKSYKLKKYAPYRISFGGMGDAEE